VFKDTLKKQYQYWYRYSSWKFMLYEIIQLGLSSGSM
jgi:hypothetical protein